jgi:hypothetical protein
MLEYGLNYFIDPTAEKVDYYELLKECETLLHETLPDLPSNPNDISPYIKIRLPHPIPIKQRNLTYETVQILRTHYKFNLLPENYFVSKIPLPDSPKDLKDEVKNAFPITERKQLRSLKQLVESLREFYIVPNKLPQSYFNLPPPKQQLPPTYHSLPSHLAIKFPILNDSTEIKNAVAELRLTYNVPFLPLDYIRTRTTLPKPFQIEEELGIILPCSSSEESLDLINNLKKKYRFDLPLGPEWINQNIKQYNKPDLPTDFNIIKTEFNLSDKINKDNSDFKQLINKIHLKYQFTTLPKDWIQSSKPDLPSLSQTLNHLQQNNINITLPIPDNENLSSEIQKLRNIFNFDQLPNDFILETILPDPRPEYLPIF